MNFLKTIPAYACLMLSASVAKAEGDKTTDNRWGAALGGNRVVRSTSAYKAVRGHFTLPSSLFVPRPNNYHSKPTVYLGSERTLGINKQVDAGMQYEDVPVNAMPPGWALNIYAQQWGVAQPNTYFNPQVRHLDGSRGPFRAGPGTENPGLTEFILTYRINSNGSVWLKMERYGMGIMQNPDVEFGFKNGVPVHDPDFLDVLNVKRVIGVNQDRALGDDWHLDNTSMVGARFSQGELMLTDSTFDYVPWDNYRANQDRTGYKPGGQDQGAPQHFIVDFPDLTAQANAAGVRAPDIIRSDWHDNPNIPGRYKNEAVNLNFKRAGVVAGVLVTPVQRIATSQ